MVDVTTFGWAMLAVLGAMFTAQYAVSIKRESDDPGPRASSDTVVDRSVAATRRTSGYLTRMLSLTVDYVARMTWTALLAFGIASFAVIYIVIGVLQFDPLAWFYLGVTALASVEAFGVLDGDPVNLAIGLAAVAVGIYLLKRGIDEVSE